MSVMVWRQLTHQCRYPRRIYANKHKL